MIQILEGEKKKGLSGCADNEEPAQRHNSSCDVCVCVVTPRDND